MQGAHQSEPEKLSKINFLEATASVFAASIFVSQDGADKIIENDMANRTNFDILIYFYME
jgi:hypothetical protein